jgi:flagellar protein FliS
MQPTARDNYLTTEVMTATSPKLHLMLIDAAIRLCYRAKEWREAGRDEDAGEAILKAEDIVGQLMAGLNQEVAPELVGQIRGVYLFIFRSLVTAHMERDEKKLADAIRILEIERETWQQLCARINAERPAPPQAFTAAPEILASTGMYTEMSSFSLDA